jgi:hypothetical protein
MTNLLSDLTLLSGARLGAPQANGPPFHDRKPNRENLARDGRQVMGRNHRRSDGDEHQDRRRAEHAFSLAGRDGHGATLLPAAMNDGFWTSVKRL